MANQTKAETTAGPWVKCGSCGDIIRSEYRHDFRRCKCKGIFVDGGADYTRIGVLAGMSYRVMPGCFEPKEQTNAD